MKSRPFRAGSATVEVTIGVVLASAAMIGVVQLMYVAGRQARVFDRRQLARHEMANVMEELMARRWDTLHPGTDVTAELSPRCRQALTDPKLSIEVVDVDPAGQGRRISIQLDWMDQAGRRCGPLRLVAWRYRWPEISK